MATAKIQISSPQPGRLDVDDPQAPGTVLATARLYTTPNHTQAWAVAYRDEIRVDRAGDIDEAADLLAKAAQGTSTWLQTVAPAGFVVVREITNLVAAITSAEAHLDRLPHGRTMAMLHTNRSIAEYRRLGNGGRSLLYGQRGRIIHTAAEADDWARRCRATQGPGVRLLVMEARPARLWARARPYLAARTGTRVGDLTVASRAWDAIAMARLSARAVYGKALTDAEIDPVLGIADQAVLTADGRDANPRGWCVCVPGPHPETWVRYERWSVDGRRSHGYVCPNDRKVVQSG